MIAIVKRIEVILEVESVELGPLRIYTEDLLEARHSPEVLDRLLLLVIEDHVLPMILDVVVRVAVLTIPLRRQLVHHRVLRQ